MIIKVILWRPRKNQTHRHHFPTKSRSKIRMHQWLIKINRINMAPWQKKRITLVSIKLPRDYSKHCIKDLKMTPQYKKIRRLTLKRQEENLGIKNAKIKVIMRNNHKGNWVPLNHKVQVKLQLMQMMITSTCQVYWQLVSIQIGRIPIDLCFRKKISKS